MNRRTALAVSMLLATLPLHAARPACKADGPLATARWVFEHAYHFYSQRAADSGEYLSPALLSLLEKEWSCRAAGSSPCAFDGDPWIDATAGEVEDPVIFSLVASPIERRRVAVRFRFGDESARAELSLVQEATTQCWLVDDLAGRKNASLRRRLQQRHDADSRG
jgi:hypothetical protein